MATAPDILFHRYFQQLPPKKRAIYRGKKDLDLIEQPLQDLLRAIQEKGRKAKMTGLQRRLKKLEGMLTDSTGLVPHTQKWLEYWDRQYHLYLTGKDPNAIWHSSIAAYRAAMKYAEESPASLLRRFLEEDRAREDYVQTASAAS